MHIFNPETGEHVTVSATTSASYSLHATMKGWALRLDGQTVSMFDTFFEAERAALTYAGASREGGKAAEVYALTARGRIDLADRKTPAAH
jgi:hypothetical protein